MAAVPRVVGVHDDLVEHRACQGPVRLRRDLQGVEHLTRQVALVDEFAGRIVDVGSDHMTLVLAGTPTSVDDFEARVRPFDIVALQRTGRVALPKLERVVAPGRG